LEDRKKRIINNQKYLQGSGESWEQLVSLFIQSASCTKTWCTASLPPSHELPVPRAAAEQFTDHLRVGYCTPGDGCCSASGDTGLFPLAKHQALLPVPREQEGEPQAVQVQS